MFNPLGYQLVIDSCKGEELYRSLHQYNIHIFKSCNGFRFVHNKEVEPDKNESSWWFQPEKVDSHPLSHLYHLEPNTHPVQKDPRFCLKLYAPNYFSLLLIHTLYSEDKNILIEEQCGGRGDLLFYLNKLGYNRFTLIENWSQLPKALMESLLSTHNIFPHLTPPEEDPKVVNLIGYTYFVKPINPNTELVITYNNTSLITRGEGESWMYRDGCLEKYSVMENKVWLATDKYGLANAYCNKNKVEEFIEKLLKYKE